MLAVVLSASLCSAADATMSMKYEGGSLPLKLHDGVKVALSANQISIWQKKETFMVQTGSITEISYGNDVHRRVGAAIGVGIVTLGIGAMLLLVKTKKHYVGIVWDDAKSGENSEPAKSLPAMPSKGGTIFKVGKGEYRGFIAALEGITGKKAVNADVSGPGGTSK